MSTRCQIGFYYGDNEQPFNKPSALIYKHSDGYEEGVMPELLEYLKDPENARNIGDPEYLSAWYLYKLMGGFEEKGYTSMGRIGFGICDGIHGDIEYYYAVYPDKVEIYETRGWDVDFDDFKLIKTVKLTKTINDVI